jgi:predicted RNA-binding protein with PUA domain
MVEVAVKSRIIEHLAYDPEKHRLRIEFRNGAIRIFAGVPPKIVKALACAKSPGSYYIDHIRTHFERLAA